MLHEVNFPIYSSAAFFRKKSEGRSVTDQPLLSEGHGHTREERTMWRGCWMAATGPSQPKPQTSRGFTFPEMGRHLLLQPQPA